MCFGGGGKSKEEAEKGNKEDAEKRVDAEEKKREEIDRRAKEKREEISKAVTERGIRGARGGMGRRSLFRAGGAGFLGRFE